MKSSVRWIGLLVMGWLVGFPMPGLAEGWKAGKGAVAITPKSPVWMAGYGERNKPSEGAVHDLWAKALALEDSTGYKSVLVTLDVVGIDAGTSKRICDAIERNQGLVHCQVVLACSHTHCGPVIGTNLITMYPMDEVQKQRVKEYTAEFEANVLKAVDAAFARLEPVTLSWETCRADFAVNRRENKEADVPALRARNALKGPVDHDVPVLRVVGEDKKIRAVVFGYACHCTTLSFYKFCGDYAGFAQIALESRYPGAQAMFVAGCGADQNPLPRRTLELAQEYGEELAGAVTRVLETPMRTIETGTLANQAYILVPLRFCKLPSREQIERDARSTTYAVANRARKLLQTLDDKRALTPEYSYPIEVWRLGDLTWVFLSGEVVVDYSLRIKRNVGSSKTWVSAYCNDVMAYIPSLRVLKEGGYEGATAMIYYGLPTSWSEDVEDQIFEWLTPTLQGVGSRE